MIKEIDGGVLKITAGRAIHDTIYNVRRDRIYNFMRVPGRFRLPFKIDLFAKIDSPQIILLIGSGHLSIASPWMENRRIEDIADPAGKPRLYDNRMPLNEFAEISVIYNLRSMQVFINGEERFFSKKERYMKLKNLSEINEKGFEIGITCTKRAELYISSLAITEYGEDLELTSVSDTVLNEESGNWVQNDYLTQKPTFESCIKNLPGEIKNEIIVTADYLKSLKNLKFKRAIEKHGNKITYVESSRGVSYALYMSGEYMHHSFQWYIVTSGKPETWRRKANPLESVLEIINETKPELAERVFYNLNECIGCREGCLARTLYEFNGKKKATCHGSAFFKMVPADFKDVRDFFGFLNDICSP